MDGASLIAKNLPLQDQFNIIEDLMLAFCEKVALPCFLCRDANPDLYAYLGYLKTQVESKPCEEDFETIRVMGKGGFGLVKGCKTFRTGKMFPEASWLYVSETKYQEEVVWLLQYQEKAAPKKSSSFCVIA